MRLRQVRDRALALAARSLPALVLLRLLGGGALVGSPEGEARPAGSATAWARHPPRAQGSPGTCRAPSPMLRRPLAARPCRNRSLVLAPQLGTGDAAFQADYSPDGRLFVTSGSDGTLRVFDGATAQLRLELAGSRGHGARRAWRKLPLGSRRRRARACSRGTWRRARRRRCSTRASASWNRAVAQNGAKLVTNHDRHLRTWALSPDGAGALKLPTGIERAVLSRTRGPCSRSSGASSCRRR